MLEKKKRQGAASSAQALRATPLALSVIYPSIYTHTLSRTHVCMGAHLRAYIIHTLTTQTHTNTRMRTRAHEFACMPVRMRACMLNTHS